MSIAQQTSFHEQCARSVVSVATEIGRVDVVTGADNSWQLSRDGVGVGSILGDRQISSWEELADSVRSMFSTTA